MLLEIAVLLAVVVRLPVAVDDADDDVFLLGNWFSNLTGFSSAKTSLGLKLIILVSISSSL